MKYQITIEQRNNSLVAIIKDTETDVKVVGKLQPYKRTKNGEEVQFLQVSFDAKKLGCENRGVVQVPKNEDGKFMMSFETNLDNKKNSSTKLSLDMFA